MTTNSSGLGSTLSATLQASDFAVVTRATQSPVATDKRVEMQFPVGPRQWLHVGGGYVRVTSVPEDLIEDRSMQAPWRFKAVPVGLGYSYALRGEGERWVPTVTASVAYLFSSMKTMRPLTAIPFAAEIPFRPAAGAAEEELGMGFGAELALSIRADLDARFFVQLQHRLCYVNGLAFSSAAATTAATASASFLRLDFALGGGVRF